MTKEYIKKLVRLAKDLYEGMEIVSGTMNKKQTIFMSKLNYLIGYIMALEDSNSKKEIS